MGGRSKSGVWDEVRSINNNQIFVFLSSYTSYSTHEMHNILTEYKPGVRGSGLHALSKKYNVRGGPKLISEWFKKWDGTEASLRKQSGGDVRSILTPKEKDLHIRKFATRKSKVEAVNYPEVKENVEKKTGKEISLRSVRRVGKKMNLSSKKRKRVLKSQGLIDTFFVPFVISIQGSEKCSFFCCRNRGISRIGSKHQEEVSECQ